MTALNFHTTASNVADGAAVDGLGKWTRRTDDRRGARLSYRLAQGLDGLERRLIDLMCAGVNAQGTHVPRPFIADYYVSLKTNPFVVLTGGAPEIHTALARGVAEALVGPRSSQYVQIAGGASWPQGTGEGGYYRSLLERFDSLRLLDLLHEAAMESNVGKAYFLCLDGLHPDEINHFFNKLLRMTAEGEKRLALPGLPPDQQPVVPTNVYITANLHTPVGTYRLDQQVLRHASILDLSPFRSVDELQRTTAFPYPPVGYQRIMLAAATHDVDAARCKLGAILGDAAINAMRLSPRLAQMMWRGGMVLGTRTLREATRYIANSFDEQGRGLFDGDDPQRNAQLALDLHAVQRVAWQLHEEGGTSLQDELLAYRSELLATIA